MFVSFFFAMKEAGIPVTLREFLTFLGAMEKEVAGYSVEQFYYLCRTSMVKDERHLDRFDRVFANYFSHLNLLPAPDEALEPVDIPEEWLEKLAERYLSEEEKAQIKALGGYKALMDTLKQRLNEQHERHQGGNKWIGTAGTSPFGAYGYNPEGIRIGQHESRHSRAVKVWDRRDFKNLDDTVEIGTRSMKVALRRLRRFAREGAAEILDMKSTIRSTAKKGGMLDIQMIPERRNAVKVLLFFDVGGSMDDHVKKCEQLFSAVRSEFKNLEYFYFHNCVYESVWKDNARRYNDKISTYEILRTYSPDYKVIFVGDASMSPYEIVQPGGAVEYFNEETGQLWLERLTSHFSKAVWINPVQQDWWGYTQSIAMIQQLMESRMFPLTLQGLDAAVCELN